MKAKSPGQLEQLDHLSVYVAGELTVKHVEPIYPVIKMTVCQAYRNASSKTAAQFLMLVKEKMPFSLRMPAENPTAASQGSEALASIPR